ncbi:MAG: hypothetical protein PVI06_11240 [Desulfobacterales bacterium]
MARLIDGTASHVTSLEQALIALVKKTCRRPALLTPHDLAPLEEIIGDDAIDYTLVIGSFHFINRIADLLNVPPEALPGPLRRFEFLRRLTVRLASRLMAKMDLAPRDYPVTYEQAIQGIRPLLGHRKGRAPEDDLAPLKSRPKMIEVLKLSLEERDHRSGLDRATLAGIQQVVEKALPANINETEDLHEFSQDPMAALAFVGTRYAYRTTVDMIDALRQKGYDDTGILDLAIAVAEANQWARIHRLLDLDPAIFYLNPQETASNPAVASDGFLVK